MEFKGVWNGRGYPVFWINIDQESHPSQSLLDNLAGLEPTPNDEVAALAKSLSESNDWPCKIHLEQSTKAPFKIHADSLMEEEQRLADILDTADDFETFVDELPE